MPLVFEVRVVPGSGKQLFTVDKAGRLKCYLKSQPEKGLANKELVTLLAKALGLTQTDVVIIAGATGRTKFVRVSLEITLEQLYTRLGIDKQVSFID